MLAWLGDLYEHIEEGDEDGAQHIMLMRLLMSLSKNDYASCDVLLGALEVERLSIGVVLMVLKMLSPHSDAMENWACALDRMEAFLREVAPRRADILLERCVEGA